MRFLIVQHVVKTVISLWRTDLRVPVTNNNHAEICKIQQIPTAILCSITGVHLHSHILLEIPLPSILCLYSNTLPLQRKFSHSHYGPRNSTIAFFVWVSVHHKLIYTRCPRRNVPDFGRVFLMLKYTDITQNTYVQIWTVTEIMAREKCGLLGGPRTVPVSWQPYLCYVVECGVIWRLFSSR